MAVTKLNRAGGNVRKMFVGGFVQATEDWIRIAEVVFASNVNEAEAQALQQSVGRKPTPPDENLWVHMVVELADGLPVLYADDTGSAAATEVPSMGSSSAVACLDLMDGDVLVVRLQVEGSNPDELADNILDQVMQGADAIGVPPQEIAGVYSAVIQMPTGEIFVVVGKTS